MVLSENRSRGGQPRRLRFCTLGHIGVVSFHLGSFLVWAWGLDLHLTFDLAHLGYVL